MGGSRCAVLPDGLLDALKDLDFKPEDDSPESIQEAMLTYLRSAGKLQAPLAQPEPVEKADEEGDMETYNKSVEKVQYYEMLYDDLTFS